MLNINLILTIDWFQAMNRSLPSVILGGFGTSSTGGGAAMAIEGTATGNIILANLLFRTFQIIDHLDVVLTNFKNVCGFFSVRGF